MVLALLKIVIISQKDIKMKIKVNYDPQTRLVKGYYPESINYASIPEPYIEISQEEHQSVMGDMMCVVDGIMQKYIPPQSELVRSKKVEKIAQCKIYLKNTDWQVVRLSDPTSQESMDEGVAEKRALARSLQEEIKNCITLEELNKINTQF